MNKFNKGLVPLSSWCDSERHTVTNPFYVISTLRSQNVGVKFRCINTLNEKRGHYWSRFASLT